MNKSIVLIGGSGFIGLNFANYFFSKNIKDKYHSKRKKNHK